MAEFVEKALEQLLPVFEQLKLVHLFSADEVDEFIRSCRAYEYKITKRTKSAKDYLAYAAFIAGKLDLVKQRRKEMKYTHRYDDIDRPLKNKCAFLFRICTLRFKKLEYFEQEIAFYRQANMLKACSQAFTRLLQFHGHIPEKYVDACRFEFFDNNSAESARTIVLMGLRKFSQFCPLWAAHFEIELRFVAQLLQRRNFFLKTDAGQEPMNSRKKRVPEQLAPKLIEGMADNDELLQLKLARIVFELAVRTIEQPKEKAKLVRKFLDIARDCGDFTSDLQKNLAELLDVLGGDIEEEIAQLPDEELFDIDTKGDADEEEGPSEKDGKTRGKAKERPQRKSVLDDFDPNDPQLKELLAKASLTEDFDQKPLDDVLLNSNRQQKKKRRVEREKTAGNSWFSLPATELDDQRRRDLELVQMRDALDPKQHYKRPDREVLPKYFQIGQIVESKADFYSARLARKQRKPTLAEELMADHETIARNKRRYSEIVRRQETTTRGAFRRAGKLPKHSRRKNKTKSH